MLLCAEHIARAAQFKVAHGYLEARAELRELSYRIEPARGYLRQLPAGSECEIRARSARRASDAPAYLMKLGETHAVGVFNYKGVDIRNINARFDYSRAYQYIYLALEQLAPDFAQFVFAHLAVGYADNCVGQHIFYRRRRVLDALNAVVQIIHLTAAPELRVHRLREHLGIVLDNIGLHRRAVVRRFFEY